jgi:[acyl-carrier-protein] S-malonyltransferase
MKELETVVVYAGQGYQHVGMGRGIYDESAEARKIFDEASNVLDFDVAELCFKDPEGNLKRASFAQPAIVTVQTAATSVLYANGFRPRQVAGHSLGEISASVASGAMSFVDGVRLAQQRGTWMEEQGKNVPGAMAASLGLELDKVEEVCEKAGIEVANVNAAGQVVVAGKRDLMAVASGLIAEYRGRFKILPIDVASHCSLMIPVREKIAEFMKGVELNDPQIPLITNVTAQYVLKAGEIRDNLARQVASRVLWLDSVKAMISNGGNVFYEVGPGNALSGIIKRIDPSVEVRSIKL